MPASSFFCPVRVYPSASDRYFHSVRWPTVINRLCDWLREFRISFYRMQMNCIEADERAYWFGKMREEIQKRSAEQVRKMEIERGLT